MFFFLQGGSLFLGGWLLSNMLPDYSSPLYLAVLLTGVLGVSRTLYKRASDSDGT
jgi:hypothetical protein